MKKEIKEYCEICDREVSILEIEVGLCNECQEESLKEFEKEASHSRRME